MIFSTTPPKSLEDLISYMSWGNFVLNANDSKIVQSFDNQLVMGRGLTVKQGALALKFCKKYRAQLSQFAKTNVDSIIDNEVWARPLREFVAAAPKVRIVKGKNPFLGVTFPYSDQLVQKIRKFKEEFKENWADFHQDEKEWRFSLTEGSINWVANNIISENFSVDDQFFEFYDKIQEISENIENYAPRLVIEDDRPVFKNTHESVPQPHNDKILDALFLAKMYGIDVWDENCENFINSEKVEPLTRKFLEKDVGIDMTINAKEYDISCFGQLLKSMTATMIVIPEHQELLHLKKWHEYLISLGYTENDMTVMFRVDNITNKAFNDYVRDHKLNTPISKDMKFVFVSRRIKKPLVKSGIDFNLAICCDPLGSHVAIKKILNDKYNTIVYIDDALPK